MPSNQENIEAKLAAYVDGELSGADREEIERHLTANPQHRKLISELMQTSAMLKDLPHVQAPADVLDSLQSQLERSALLGRPEELSGDETYKIGFWTQFRAIAAILILTIGLATVVYFVLPRNAPNIELATKDSPPVTVEETAKPDVAMRSTTLPMEMHAKNAGATGGADELRKDSVVAAAKGGFALEPKREENDLVPPDIRRQLALNGVGDDATFIIVDTANAPLANATVSNYLNYNRATWEQMPISHGETENLIPSPVQALTNAGQVADDLRRGANRYSPQQNVTSADNIASNAMEQQASVQQRATIPGSQMDLSQAVPSPVVSQQAIQNVTGNLIVARRLNRTQIAELNGLLNQQSVGKVSNFSRNGQERQTELPNLPIQTSTASGTIAPGAVDPLARLKIGDTVRLTFPDPTAANLSFTLQIDPIGNLKLDDVGDVPVVGLTLSELNQTLVAKYRDAHVDKPVPLASEIVDAIEIPSGTRELHGVQDLAPPASAPAAEAPVGGLSAQTAAAQNAPVQEAVSQNEQLQSTPPANDQPTDVVVIVREMATNQQFQTDQAMPAAPGEADRTTPVEAKESPSTAPSTAPTTAPTTQP